jgi:hypothetical protein
MADQPDLGLLEAHTPRAENISGGDGAQPASIEASPDLLDADKLLLDTFGRIQPGTDAIAAAANIVAAGRRARGRPAGALNRKTSDTIKYLAELGYKDPMIILTEIANADTMLLAKATGSAAIDVMKLKAKAASDLMPYHHSQQPKDVNVRSDNVHLFVMGEMPEGQTIQGAFMDLTGNADAGENEGD